MKTWFDKTFSTHIWWEIRLRNVAESLGLKISWASCYFAQLAKEQHRNWRFTDGWNRYLEDVAKYGFNF